MVVGIHPGRVGDAVRGVQHPFPRFGGELAQGGDASLAQADIRPGMAGGVAGEAGDNGGGVANEQIGHG